MPDAVLSRLRTATASAHEDLERTIDIESTCRRPESYRNLLESFLGFYETAENHLGRITELPESAPEDRRKTPWLISDLHALGLSSQDIAAIPRCEPDWISDTPPFAFGCFYVMEGATLGGRQISRLLEGSPIPVGARKFFNGYGADTALRWQGFCTALEAFAMSGDFAAEIVAGGEAAFAQLRRWVGSPGSQ